MLWGTQKDRLIKTVLLNTQNKEPLKLNYNLTLYKIELQFNTKIELQFYTKIICLSALVH